MPAVAGLSLTSVYPISMLTIYFTLLPCFHIGLVTLVARQPTLLKPFSLVVPRSRHRRATSTMPTLDERTSLVAWTVDVHPGRPVAIELRDSSGLATKTHPILVQSPKSEDQR
ncbi:hypothetical protein PM082_014185 [Marasmius tenuissimus]|nr:hypothetical protein PM082_014185 [Marasmius tenuissimus]